MSSDKTNFKIKMNWLSEQFVQDGICIFVKTSRTSSIVRRLFTFKGNWNLSNDERLTERIQHVSIKFSSIAKHLSTEAPALLVYWIIQIFKLLVVSLSNTCPCFSICTLCFTSSNVRQKSYSSCCSQSCLYSASMRLINWIVLLKLIFRLNSACAMRLVPTNNLGSLAFVKG